MLNRLVKAAQMLVIGVLAVGCANVMPMPTWSAESEHVDAEYEPFLAKGTSTVSGQAFLSQRGGNVVRAAGRTVTLDPATVRGAEWWAKAGTVFAFRDLVPPSPSFQKARRTTVADADGRFKFSDIPPGKYYVLTDVTWTAGSLGLQGGLVGKLIEVPPATDFNVILSELAAP